MMENAACPECQYRSMTQDSKNPRIFNCSKCSKKFVLLPVRPEKRDLSAIWDYLIQAKVHLKELEQHMKTQRS